MLEPLSRIASMEALPLLTVTIFVAGIVRGFAGFGPGMLFLPVAATVLPPIWVVTAFVVADIPAIAPLVPRALRDGDRVEAAQVLPAGFLGLFVGLAFLRWVDPEPFRWLISISALVLLVALVSGRRYRKQLGFGGRSAVGAVAGICCGAAGVAGPPIVLFQMGGVRPAAEMRANIILILGSLNAGFLAIFALGGELDMEPVALGLVLAVPYALGGLIGQRMFDPAHERIYRGSAYLAIAVAALASLPIY